MKHGCLISLAVFVVLVGIVALLASDWDISSKKNRVGVVEIKGVITNSQETVKHLKEFRKDDSIKAIIVRIDSPGGAVGPSQEIYTEIRRTIRTKPVVASMGSVAASGGYYIASAANTIVANAGTITGSIGVIIHFPNLKELLDKVGYKMTTIKSGPFKDIGNFNREMTPEEQSLIQDTIDEAYSQFVRDVAEGRNLPQEEVKKVADGRIIMGEKARELKLVDQIGNFEDAVDKAAELGKIEGEPDVTYKKKKRTLLDLIAGSDANDKLNELLGESPSFLRYQLQFGG